MTTPAPARTPSTDPPATIEIADRDREWQATTDEAVARIDNALTTISARVAAVDDSAARNHLTGAARRRRHHPGTAHPAPRSPCRGR